LTDVTRSQKDLARWILLQEIREDESDATAQAVERTWRKLLERLTNIFTVEGCDLLGKRAVYLARTDAPLLEGASAVTTIPATVHLLHNIDEEQAQEAAVAVYANVINLLVAFIGEELAMRSIRDLWQDASLHGTGSTGQETIR
jgi:hypothetical protein